MALPPGQWLIDGFPRFGAHRGEAPPQVPADAVIEVVGLDGGVRLLSPADLAVLPRVEVPADLHCVSGWSAVGLRWAGVRLADVVDLQPGGRAAHLVVEGHDGYRAVLTAEDARADDVLLADHLDGAPLTPAHGAPVRLVSPAQYGFVSVKHLRRIELHATEPRTRYHPVGYVDRALRVVKPHPRARVAMEERHRYLPSWLARRVYRVVVPLLAPRVRPTRTRVDRRGAPQ